MTTAKVLESELEAIRLKYSQNYIHSPKISEDFTSIAVTLYPRSQPPSPKFYIILEIHIPKQYPEQVPVLKIEDYAGLTQEKIDEILHYLLDLSLDMRGKKMLEHLVDEANEKLDDLFLEHKENAAKESSKPKEKKEEHDDDDDSSEIRRKISLHLDRLRTLDEGEEQEMHEKWLYQRKEEKAIPDGEDGEEGAEDYSVGCELIPAKDLFIIHLLRLVSSTYSKLQGRDETEVKNQMYAELKGLDIVDDDCLELLKKRATRFFAKLFKEKVSNEEKVAKKRNNDRKIHDLLFKPYTDVILLAGNEDPDNAKINMLIRDKSIIPEQTRARAPSDKSTSTKSSFGLKIEKVEGAEAITDKSDETPPLNEDQTAKEPTKSISRYYDNFQEIKLLGKGASGAVYQVKNKLDGRFYAIKKIVIRAGQKLNRIMREVQTLSRLNHNYIIRYYQAWLEEVEDGHEELEMELPGPEIEFEDEKYDLDSKFLHTSISGFSESPTHSNTLDFEDFDMRQKKNSILYIQTEYCDKALRDVLKEHQDSFTIWKWFRQMLDALNYLHSQKIIHRDLKPGNIFLDSKGDAKVGDFGLATNFQSHSQLNLSHQIEDLLMKKCDEEDLANDQTLGVGTFFYRAPEVDLRNDRIHYNEKVDVYSLGILFFEMWHPFSTKYERFKVLKELKVNGKLPPKFEETHPRQSRLINLMLERDPHQRPRVIDIINSDLLPSKVEDEHMKEVIKIISNPSTTIYKKLISAIFTQEPHMTRGITPWESLYITSQEFFLNLIAQRMANYFRNLGTFPVKTPLFDSHSGSKSSKKTGYGLWDFDPRVPYLNKSGEIEILKLNPRRELRALVKYLSTKITNLDVLKCFEIGDVYLNDSRGEIRKEKLLTYDSFYLVDEGYREVNISEVIAFNLSSLHRLFSLYPDFDQIWSNIKVSLTSFKLLYLLCKHLSITKNLAIREILKIVKALSNGQMSFNDAKAKIQQISNINDKGFDQLMAFFSLKGSFLECKKRLEAILADQEALTQIFEELEKIVKASKELYDATFGIFGERAKKIHSTFPEFEMNLAILDPDMLFKKDIFYEVRFRDQRANRNETISYGGIYFAKVAARKRSNEPEIKVQRYASAEERAVCLVFHRKEAAGFTVLIEKVSRIVYSHVVKAQNQPDKLEKIHHQFYFKYEVMICSEDFNPMNLKSMISMICWHLGIPNIVNSNPKASVEEALEYSAKMDIPLSVIIKERKILIKWRGKDKNITEKELTLEEFETFLTKTYKSKEHS